MNCIHDVIRSQSFIYFQLLRFLLEIMNDWSNIKNTKQFVILLDYAFLSRKCIFMFICKETLQKLSEKVDSFGSHKKMNAIFLDVFFFSYLQLLYVVDVPAIAQANSFGFGDTIKQNSTIYIDNTNELVHRRRKIFLKDSSFPILNMYCSRLVRDKQLIGIFNYSTTHLCHVSGHWVGITIVILLFSFIFFLFCLIQKL